MSSSPVIEILAQELHRNYRAAEKSLRTTDVVGERAYMQHDHGWEGCHRQKYFRKRAALLIKRSVVVNPETLGEAEQALSATVLLRRLAVEGKIIIPSRSTDRFSRTVGDYQPPCVLPLATPYTRK